MCVCVCVFRLSICNRFKCKVYFYVLSMDVTRLIFSSNHLCDLFFLLLCFLFFFFFSFLLLFIFMFVQPYTGMLWPHYFNKYIRNLWTYLYLFLFTFADNNCACESYIPWALMCACVCVFYVNWRKCFCCCFALLAKVSIDFNTFGLAVIVTVSYAESIRTSTFHQHQ